MRGELLYLGDHVEFFHEDVAVVLVGGHLELLQQNQRDKGIKTDSGHQNHYNHYSRHAVLNDVLTEANSGQRYDDNLKAIVERYVLGGKEQTMRE